MNKSHGFTKENLLRSLPPGLANDPRMVALAEAIAGLLVQQKEETGRLEKQLADGRKVLIGGVETVQNI